MQKINVLIVDDNATVIADGYLMKDCGGTAQGCEGSEISLITG